MLPTCVPLVEVFSGPLEGWQGWEAGIHFLWKSA